MRAFLPSLSFTLAVLCGGPLLAEVDYVKSVKPMLRERCYSCHGALKQKADLRLDTVASMLKGGEDGPAIRRGDAAKSLLIERVTATDLEERMPPKHEGEPFTEDQVKLLRDWIAAGAKAPSDEKPEPDPREHWAFRPRVRPPLPDVAGSKWVRSPIDAFVAKQHETHGLAPQKEAPREILLRRLYLDLVGVPPTLDEIAAVQKDETGGWYEATVARLLDDPRHGERWARHWMDIWRYSDWWGLGDQLRNSQKHIWHWRDWIVEALNADTPYDEMVKQMLAADELYPNDLQKLRATGFLARNYFLFNRNQWLEETVEHVSKGLLGLTMNCAKCHDHKYDPIAQPDFYKMRAFFEPYHVRLDVAPGEVDLSRDGIPRVYDGVLDTPTYRFVRGEESKPDKSAPIAPGVPALLGFKELAIQPITLPPEAWQPERRPWVLDQHLSAARKNVESAAAELAKSKEKLAAAEKRNSEFLATAPAAIPPAEPASVLRADHSTIAETFATMDAKRWKLFGGDWSHTPGRLEQKRDGAARAAARLLDAPPRDFDASVRFTILGGSVYRSVGLSFDASQVDPTTKAAAGDSEINIYASGWSKGPKVQAAFSRGAGWQYPQEGMRTLPVELNREHTLRVQARDTLVNVSFNGEPLLAWRSPLARRDGAMQVITFDAMAVFHEVRIAPLKADAMLREPSAPAAAIPVLAKPADSLEAAKTAVDGAKAECNVAELALAAAKAELASAERRTDALRASWAKAESESEKAAVAVRSEREAMLARARHSVADAELRLARGGDKKSNVEKELKAAQAALEKAAKAAEAPVKPGESFSRPYGAKWTPTRFRSSGADDPDVPFQSQSTGRRKALAEWITDSRNPLTARVAANHIWMRHMGTPLVGTVFEFGRKGTPPTHPELLDWLASELVEHGWSMKQLHRLIVTSATYRMSSSLAGGEANAAKDPDNVHLWRRAPIRLDAQVVRDSILAVSGELDLTMGGPSIPAGGQETSKRRSLYFFHSNNDRNLFLTTFDDAAVKECYRRDESIVPQQALALTNSRLVHDASRKIADRLSQPQVDDATFVHQAFAFLLGIEANESEIAAGTKALQAWRKLSPASAGDATGAARTNLVWALLNHNDFVTLR
jgi:hypothetical protein